METGKSSRRYFLETVALGSGALVGSGWANHWALAQDVREQPLANALVVGDLLWPKEKSETILYSGNAKRKQSDAAMEWEAEKKAFIERVNREPSPQAFEVDAACILGRMTYQDYLNNYFKKSALTPPTSPKRGSCAQHFGTGHVAMVCETSPEPQIIEAVWGSIGCVRKISYAEWLADRRDQFVFHGALDFKPDVLSAIAHEAVNQKDIPYDFWKFDLADTSGFYCSKLIWYCVKHVTAIAVDGNDDSKRSFWFSPRQLWNSSKYVKPKLIPVHGGY